jgi:hypothetical protein
VPAELAGLCVALAHPSPTSPEPPEEEE